MRIAKKEMALICHSQIQINSDCITRKFEKQDFVFSNSRVMFAAGFALIETNLFQSIKQFLASNNYDCGFSAILFTECA